VIAERARRAPAEVIVDGYPRRRPRWIEVATSADHKDVGRVLIAGALGFLFIALVELLLMRLQLAVPENSLLTPVTFNRLLSGNVVSTLLGSRATPMPATTHPSMA